MGEYVYGAIEARKAYEKVKNIKGPSGESILREFQYAHAKKESSSRRSTVRSISESTPQPSAPRAHQ